MSLTLVGLSNEAEEHDGEITVPIPEGLDGDLLLVMACGDPTTNEGVDSDWPTPEGWTRLLQSTDSEWPETPAAVFYTFAGEGTTNVFNSGDREGCTYQCLRVRDAGEPSIGSPVWTGSIGADAIIQYAGESTNLQFSEGLAQAPALVVRFLTSDDADGELFPPSEEGAFEAPFGVTPGTWLTTLISTALIEAPGAVPDYTDSGTTGNPSTFYGTGLTFAIPAAQDPTPITFERTVNCSPLGLLVRR